MTWKKFIEYAIDIAGDIGGDDKDIFETATKFLKNNSDIYPEYKKKIDKMPKTSDAWWKWANNIIYRKNG